MIKQDRFRFSAMTLRMTASAALIASVAPLATGQDADPSDDANSQTTDARRLDTVTVEATRREGVTTQDVPIAVTAYSGELLEDSGVVRLNDLEQLAPSIQVTQTESAGSGTTISIRGIGTGSNNLGFEPAVGVLVDGVFRTRTGNAIGELPDLESIEVLRGPQGTLFGRNTSSGVVSINTKAPQQEQKSYIGGSVGNFDAYSIELGTTGALTERWSGRIDAKYREREGYIDDVNSDREFNNLDRWFLRGQLLYEGVDSELRLIADVSETDEECCVAVNLLPGTTGPAVNAATDSLGRIGIQESDPFDREVAISPNRDYADAVSEWGVSAQFDKTLDIGRLTSITSYRDWDLNRNQDIDFSGIDRAYRDGYEGGDATFSQELRLQGETGRINWLVGAFYMNQDLDLFDPITFGEDAALYADTLVVGNGLQIHGSYGAGVPSVLSLADPSLANVYIPAPTDGEGSLNRYRIETDAISLFTHNEVSITDPLTLTVGLRYNYEEKDLDETINATSATCEYLAFDPLGPTATTVLESLGLSSLVCNPAVNPEANGQFTDSLTDEEVTGTLKLAYEILPNALVYGSYARGYKAGGWNLDHSAFGDDPDSPSVLGGASGDPADQAFDAEIVDAYEIGLKTSFADGRVTLNGAAFYQDITDYQLNLFTGVNFETFNVGAETRGVELDIAASPVDGLVLQSGLAYTDATLNEDVFARDGSVLEAADEQLANVPEWVLTGAATYSRNLTQGIKGLAHMNVRWNDEIYVSGGDLSGVLNNDAFATVGARLGISDINDKWEISLVGENLTDEEYFLSGFVVPEQTAVAVYPSSPLFYGLEGKIRF